MHEESLMKIYQAMGTDKRILFFFVTEAVTPRVERIRVRVIKPGDIPHVYTKPHLKSNTPCMSKISINITNMQTLRPYRNKTSHFEALL